VAETTSLLRMRRGNSTEGSNPSRSATIAESLARGLRNFFCFFRRFKNPMSSNLFSPDDERWMSKAIEAAQQAELEGDVPVGCVVIHPELGLVASAYNKREADQDPTAHAEVLALRQAAQNLRRWRLSDCTIYVTLEPCFMCAGALVNARVKRVVYAAIDSKAGACESLANVLSDERLNHRCEWSRGVLEEPAREQLKNFFRARRKKTPQE
jgi:tRNA(adenine34) deaminase